MPNGWFNSFRSDMCRYPAGNANVRAITGEHSAALYQDEFPRQAKFDVQVDGRSHLERRISTWLSLARRPENDSAEYIISNSTQFAKTFRKMNASSSHTGLIPFPWMTFVLNFFLTVSAGKPYMSTSTQVPTFRSVKN